MNLEELVTKDYLESRLEVRFSQQQSYIDKQFADVNGNFRTLYWLMGIVVAATVGPLLERLIGF